MTEKARAQQETTPQMVLRYRANLARQYRGLERAQFSGGRELAKFERFFNGLESILLLPAGDKELAFVAFAIGTDLNYATIGKAAIKRKIQNRRTEVKKAA